MAKKAGSHPAAKGEQCRAQRQILGLTDRRSRVGEPPSTDVSVIASEMTGRGEGPIARNRSTPSPRAERRRHAIRR